MKKLLSLLLSIVMVFSCLSCLAITSVSALDSRIENALQWAVSIANDNSHGYSWDGRWGPDYDCSSLVITAFKNSGFNVGSATYTGNMRTVFEKAGFTWIPKSQINLSNSSQLQRGDILLNESSHTEIYLGNGQNVGAHRGYKSQWCSHSNSDGKYHRHGHYSLGEQQGDQDGGEISVAGYYNYPWDGVLRYQSQEPVNNPTGVVDSITAGPNSITVRGWAFDVDDINTQLNIHVYIGGNSGDSNAEGIGWITANTYRPDVDKVYGCGGYHGYEVTIPTSKTGSQPVYIYAINVGSGSNQLIGSNTVDISKDTEAPTISRTYLSEISKDGYRVCCETKDNVGIKKVRIATWTRSNQSDLIWHDANHNGTGTWYIDLKRSDYAESQVYFNHIYVYDYANNHAVAVKDMVYETNGPEITSQTVSNMSSGGFRFTCKVKDETKVSSVRVAVWTDKNGQDDLKWYDFTVNGSIASRYIYASDHNNETGSYIIHTYAYDKYDNCSSTSFATTVSATPIEVASVEYNGNTYKTFSSGMNWDEAKAWCEEQGGHLVTISSKEEWQSVKSLLEEFNGIRCWLGAESTSGEWKWVTEESFEFSSWGENQPDCSEKVEYYLGTWDTESEILDCYLWNDYTITGDKIGGFVMEIEKEKDFEYSVLEDGTAEITAYIGAETDIDIPPVIDGYTITAIGYEAFYYNKSLLKVNIPNTVTRIGESAFERCVNLKEVNIPDSVKTIEDRAFTSCEKLEKIELPNSLTYIGKSSLGFCLSVKEIIIPPSVTYIGREALGGCYNLERIIVDKQNLVYDSRNDCNAVIETKTNTLTQGCYKTIIPNDITSLGEGAFYYCNKLETITIPENITSIGRHAFMGGRLSELIILNPECVIFNQSDTVTVPTIIKGYIGSTAQAYAEKYKRTFEALDQTEEKLGDSNGDGDINILDATEIQRHIAQLSTIPEDRLPYADTNKDTRVSILDATQIQLFIAKLIPSL